MFVNLVQMAVNDRTNRPLAFRLPIGRADRGVHIDAVTLAMQQIRNAR